MQAKRDYNSNNNSSSSSSSSRHCNIANNIHHGIAITDEDAGEIICSRCGVVLEEKIVSYVQEFTRKNSGDANSNSRSHMMAVNAKCVGSSTSIGIGKSFGSTDHTGKTISKRVKDSLARLQNTGNLQKTNQKQSQRSMNSAMVKLNGLIHKLDLSENVHLETVKLFKRAQEAKITRGRSVIGVVAACLYHMCKESDIPRDMAEISEHSNMRKKDLFAFYRVTVDTLGLYSIKIDSTNRKNNNDDEDTKDCNIAKLRHTKYIPKIASRLDLPQRICRNAARLILAQDDHILSGKNPRVVAATAIYLTCNNDKIYNDMTQRKVSEASGITEVSIRNVSKQMKQKKLC